MADWSIAPLSSQWATRGGSKYACAALRADIANLCIFNHDTTVAATCSVTQAAVEKLGTGVAGCRHRHEGVGAPLETAMAALLLVMLLQLHTHLRR